MARRNSLKDEWQFETEIESGNQNISIHAIQLPANQPRRYFDPHKLQQLTESIRQHGILEPLLVRPVAKAGMYELVAGERRFRAAKAAELDTVPVTIRELSDEESLQLALVENLQREDLNPVEETEGILQLLGLRLKINAIDVPALLYRMRNEVIGNSNQNVLISLEAEAVQTVFSELATISWESFATTRLPLLNLPPDVLEALRSGKIAYTKAQAVSRIKDEAQRSQVLEEAIVQELSLAQIKEKISNLKMLDVDLEKKPPSLKGQIKDVLRLAHRSKVWDDPKKQKRLEKLLADLRTLVSDAN
ncbi:ParB/RepB/Spo0J family partition protein [Cyanobacteria bacterium FACHB-63]|nr:ParB/RepB/Spo0J family partition protein [Cyanobacteria bacterium FACHB-63]